MEDKLLNEISYLTRLIEQHKQISANHNSYRKQEDRKMNVGSSSAFLTQKHNRSNYSYVKPTVPPGRVHVNPNFQPRVGGIHVNPRIGTKSSVHVNPKMIQNFASKNTDKRFKSDMTVPEQNSGHSRLVQTKIEPSIYVNPKLMKELSSVKVKEKFKNLVDHSKVENKPVRSDSGLIIKSKTKLVKNNQNLNSLPRRQSNSNLVSLSKRKLIRIRRSSKTGSILSPVNPGKSKRLSCSNLRKTKVSTKYKLVIEHVNGFGGFSAITKSVIKSRQTGLNKYKIDRTHIEKVKKRFSIGKNNTNPVNKKTSGLTTGLVRIGGILYKSSRNQLIRSSNDQPTSKRKRCIINVKGDRFVMASNGKKLRRLNSTTNSSRNIKNSSLVSRVDIGGMTFVEKTPNVLVRAHTKHNISTKAKQRSIQILRNKMRKNNQPCLIFQKFGYCTAQVKGTCPKLHDKKQVALCRNFLQGKCLLDNCTMSHSVCPEKMPTCKYFLEGCCIRDQCPYLHVKVSSNTPICTQFLRGYCANGNECKQRHVYLCAEFERSGNCAKGKYCAYPHKVNSSSNHKNKRKANKILEKKLALKKKISKLETPKLSSLPSSSSSSQPEDRKRYYDEAGGSNEEFEQKREHILNSIKIMNGVRVAEIHGDDMALLKINEERDETIVPQSSQGNNESDEENTCPKRTPLGPLPAYIPID